LSEAITNHVAGDVITAKSAGSQPAGEVHPLSLKYLNEAGVLTEGLKSQSWDEFEAFAPDLVITVCDSAAGESCPVWFGKSVKVHWGLSDPSKLTGNEEDIARAFNDTIAQISARVTDLKTIAEQPFTPDSLRASLAKLGAQ
jgi:arsenate reductase